MPFEQRTPRTRRPTRSTPSTDHTRWIALAIELVAIVGAVAFAYVHTGS